MYPLAVTAIATLLPVLKVAWATPFLSDLILENLSVATNEIVAFLIGFLLALSNVVTLK